MDKLMKHGLMKEAEKLWDQNKNKFGNSSGSNAQHAQQAHGYPSSTPPPPPPPGASPYGTAPPPPPNGSYPAGYPASAPTAYNPSPSTAPPPPPPEGYPYPAASAPPPPPPGQAYGGAAPAPPPPGQAYGAAPPPPPPGDYYGGGAQTQGGKPSGKQSMQEKLMAKMQDPKVQAMGTKLLNKQAAKMFKKNAF